MFCFSSIVICRSCQIFCIKLYRTRSFSTLTRKNETFLKCAWGERIPFKLASVNKLQFFCRKYRNAMTACLSSHHFTRHCSFFCLFLNVGFFLQCVCNASANIMAPFNEFFPTVISYIAKTFSIPYHWARINIFFCYAWQKIGLFGKCDCRCNCNNRSVQMLPEHVIIESQNGLNWNWP